jgi:hypothetical protein
MGIWYSEYKNGLVFLKVDRYAHRIRQFHQHAPATPQTTGVAAGLALIVLPYGSIYLSLD